MSPTSLKLQNIARFSLQMSQEGAWRISQRHRWWPKTSSIRFAVLRSPISHPETELADTLPSFKVSCGILAQLALKAGLGGFSFIYLTRWTKHAWLSLGTKLLFRWQNPNSPRIRNGPGSGHLVGLQYVTSIQSRGSLPGFLTSPGLQTSTSLTHFVCSSFTWNTLVKPLAHGLRHVAPGWSWKVFKGQCLHWNVSGLLELAPRSQGLHPRLTSDQVSLLDRGTFWKNSSSFF